MEKKTEIIDYIRMLAELQIDYYEKQMSKHYKNSSIQAAYSGRISGVKEFVEMATNIDNFRKKGVNDE